MAVGCWWARSTATFRSRKIIRFLDVYLDHSRYLWRCNTHHYVYSCSVKVYFSPVRVTRARLTVHATPAISVRGRRPDISS